MTVLSFDNLFCQMKTRLCCARDQTLKAPLLKCYFRIIIVRAEVRRLGQDVTDMRHLNLGLKRIPLIPHLNEPESGDQIKTNLESLVCCFHHCYLSSSLQNFYVMHAIKVTLSSRFSPTFDAEIPSLDYLKRLFWAQIVCALRTTFLLSCLPKIVCADRYASSGANQGNGMG